MTLFNVLQCVRPLFWFYAAFSMIDLVAKGLGLFATLQHWRKAPEREPSDISEKGLRLPEEASGALQQLRECGFERLGEFSIKLSGLSSSVEGWVFVDQSRTTHVEVCVSNRLTIAVFISTFHDDAILETGYPGGSQSRDDTDYRARIVSKSVKAAYHAHIEHLAEFQLVHGDPRKMNSMADFLAYSQLYNTRYARRKIRPNLWRFGLQVGANIYALVIIAGALLIQRYVQPLLFLIGVGVLLLPAIMIDTWFGISVVVDWLREKQLRARVKRGSPQP